MVFHMQNSSISGKNNKPTPITKGILPRKEFKHRNSELTDMLKIDHFKSLRHLFVAILITWIINNTFCNILGSGSVTLGIKYFAIAFGQFHIVILTWFLMFGSTIGTYVAFKCWANHRTKLTPKSVVLNIWDKSWLIAFLIYIGIFLYSTTLTEVYKLPLASAAIILGEQIRFTMKIHAFVRSITPDILTYKQHSDQPSPLPEFSNFIYFLFAPTLVYKRSYPRTKTINWYYVITCFVEAFSSVLLVSFITAHYFVPEFKNYGQEPITWKSVVMSIFNTIFPASLMYLLGFYCLLHAWLNAWAEMLKFGDRMFYKDWWNATSYSVYYRKWNMVIHDYLHSYIYRDVYEVLVPGSKLIALCSVFFISALVHEYIIGFMMGFFYPVLFIEYLTFAPLFSILKIKDQQFLGNTFIWWSLTSGIGIHVTLYSIEYYARINCPVLDNETMLEKIMPRSWFCYRDL